jgi:hypothetical protein
MGVKPVDMDSLTCLPAIAERKKDDDGNCEVISAAAERYGVAHCCAFLGQIAAIFWPERFLRFNPSARHGSIMLG